MHSQSPSLSTPSAGPHPPPQLMVDTAHGGGPTSPATTASVTPSHGQVGSMNPPSHHPSAFRSPPLSASGQRPMGPSEMHQSQGHYNNQGQHGTTLPPFSAIDSMGPPRSHPTNVSSMRYHSAPSNSKRPAPSSNVTSADSTDAEEDDGELPASGLVAPWEVLRGLADVAIERAAQVR